MCFSSFSLPQSCGCNTVCHTLRQALCATSVWECAEIKSRGSLTPYSWILPRGASVSSGSLTSCQEVVLVGDGSLVLNSWETYCIIRLEKSLDQSVFFWLWTVDLKLSEPRFPSCLTCMSTNSTHKYLAVLEWLQVSLKSVGSRSWTKS